MKKKALSLALALVMCLGLATPTLAGGLYSPEISVWVSDNDRTNFNPNSQTTPLSGLGWAYAPGTRTLTLENFKGDYIGIYRTGNITLELKGDNVLESIRFLSGDFEVDNDNITIVGNGALTTDSMISNVKSLMQTSGNISSSSFSVTNSKSNYRMTGGTLNIISEFGVGIESEGTLSLEGGTATVQGGTAAIWCERMFGNAGQELLSVGGRKMIGGETAADTQKLSIQHGVRKWGQLSMPVATVSAGDLILEQDKTQEEAIKGSNAAKYVYIADTQPEQPTQSPAAKDFACTLPQSLTYDGSSKTAAVRAAVTSSVHSGYFTLAFVDRQNNPVTDLVKPGTYRVLARVSAHGGYAAGEVSLGSVTITESPGLHGKISISVGDDASQSNGGTAYVVSDVIITVYASPDPGYQLSTIRVVRDDNGQQVALSGSGNTRTFRMPAADVSIQAEFSVR